MKSIFLTRAYKKETNIPLLMVSSVSSCSTVTSGSSVASGSFSIMSFETKKQQQTNA